MAFAALAIEVLPYTWIPCLERIIHGMRFFNPIDIDGNAIADNGGFEGITVLQAIIGATHVGEVSELSQGAVPADDLDVGCSAADTASKAFITGGAMRGTTPSEEYFELLNTRGPGIRNIDFAPGLLVGWKPGQMGVGIIILVDARIGAGLGSASDAINLPDVRPVGTLVCPTPMFRDRVFSSHEPGGVGLRK